MSKRARYSSPLAFIDMLLNYLMSVSFLFMLSFILIQAKKPVNDEAVKRQAEYIIKITWQPESTSDVDLWVYEPSGAYIFFGNKQGKTTHLERDDLGQFGDVAPDGTVIKWNEENAVLRGVQAGEYKVSAHLYTKRDEENPQVKWELIKINPSLRVVARGEVTLSAERRESGLVQFKLDGAGNVVEVSKDEAEQLAVRRTLRGPL